MKHVFNTLILLALLATPAVAADSWNEGDGDGGWFGGDWDEGDGAAGYPVEYRRYRWFDGYVEEFRDGNCKVERRWEGDGDYREERECDGD